MTKLQEHLYQYIMEDRYSALQEDEAYLMVWRKCRRAEAKLTAALTKEQQRLLSRYMDEENYLAGIQQRHIFRETLALVHDILNVPL